MVPVLFAVVVFVWGTTWIAIHLQLGVVPAEVSIFWRFSLAAAVLWGWLLVSGRVQRARWRDHRWFAALGLTLFSLNFMFMYAATQHVASGIVSVVFTMATVFNALNQWAFMGRRPSARTLIGAALGIAGIAFLFAHDVLDVGLGSGTILGVLLAAGGSYCFSLGNLASLQATRSGIDLPNAVARGMLWGAALLAAVALMRGYPFIVDWRPAYFLSLLYLAVPGSVIGFVAYLSLVARVGADRAAYATVLFPVVALTISTLVEGYEWTLTAFIGLALVLAGNIVVFARWPGRRAAA
ncbi:EamA family transporter [Pseudoxanthobacter sp.]|uniref:DMT family transporter n=1 Tax=Pseudoxanthobacter sp. TaxID=1925742 RepID=UPI002FE42370